MSTPQPSPKSIDPNDQLPRFLDALHARGVTPERLDHYVRWVRHWLSRPPEPASRRSAASAFASSLASAGTPEWQCRQAFQAVRIWTDLYPAEEDRTPAPGPVEDRRTWEHVLSAMRRRLHETNYSLRTAASYLDWVRRFAEHTPEVPTESETLSRSLDSFLGALTTGRNLSPASVAQARNALAWLAKKVLFIPFELQERGEAHHGKRLPTVLSPERVAQLLAHCPPPWSLLFRLQYGCGLRLAELLDLRVQDLDLGRSVLLVRKGKGDKDRRLPLPLALHEPLQAHLLDRRALWEHDKSEGCATVDLPNALARKFPRLASSWEWQYLFPSSKPLRHPSDDRWVRWHPMEGTVRAALRRAADSAGLEGRVHPHILRHCYATHLLESSMPLREIQELMGHARIETTMVYLHVQSSLPRLRSPLDSLPQAGPGAVAPHREAART